MSERLYRSATIRVRATDDDEDLTAEVVAATEQPVMTRLGAEVLDMAGADLSRFKRNPVVLDAHNNASVENVLGAMPDARIEARRLVGKVQFSGERGRRAHRLVKAGHLRGVSIGYVVHEWQAIRAGEVDSRTGARGPAMVARKWELLEVSLVPVPADPSAGVREMVLQRALGAQETTMVHGDTRAAAIRALAPRGMEADAERLVAAGVSVEAARGELLRLRRARPTLAPVAGRMADVSDPDLLASLRAAFGAAPRLMPRLSSPGVRFADVADEVLARSLRGGLGGSAA